MASRTQLRLGQITGSFGDFEGGIIDTRSASSATGVANIELVSGSMVGVLSEMASSVLRMHGHDTFASNAFSTLKDLDGDTRITYVQGAETTLHADDGTQKLSIGANIFASASFVPEANLTRDLGTSSVHWRTLHVGQVDATGLSGSVAGTGIANDQVVISNNGTLEGDSNFTFDGSTLTLGGGAGLSVDGSATITGNLTVNGSQTVLDTTSLVIEDSVIALASGSAANADVNSAMVFQRATADLGGGSDMQNGALMFLQGTGFKLGYTNDNAETAQGSLAIADDDLGDVYVGKLLIDGSTNTLDVTANDLTAVAAAAFKVDAATDITLDADSGIIKFEDGGTRTGLLEYVSAQNTFALSSSAGNDLGLDANTGNIMFAQAGAGGSSPSTAAVNVATTNEIKFGHYDAPNTAFNVGFLTLKDNAVSVLSASSGLQIDAGSAAAELRLVTTGSSAEFVSLKAPNNIAGNTNLTFVLPAADGSANQVLQTDGSGNLTFGDASASATTKKQVLVIDAGIAAGTDISIDSGETGVSYIGDTIDDLSQGGSQGKVLDVFVNGQLLVSGSNAQRIAGSRDYEISSSTELAFAFDLEADDLVQIIKRG